MIAVNTLDNWMSPMIYVVHNNELGYPMHLSYKTAKYKNIKTPYTRPTSLPNPTGKAAKSKNGYSGPSAN